MKWSPILLLVVCVNLAWSARILLLFPIAVKSHQNLIQAIVKTLATRGHDVVLYTALPLSPDNRPTKNFTEFFIDNLPSTDKIFSYDVFMEMLHRPPTQSITFMWNMPSHMGQTALENKHLKKLIDSNEKFDLIILETVLTQEVLLGFTHKFKAPVITIQPFGSFSLVNKLAGNSLDLAFIPDFALPYSNHMSFYERALNAYAILRTLYIFYNQYLPTQDEHMRKVFKDPTLPTLVDLLHNTSLFINNAYPNIQYSQPYSPNIIPIGGIHLAKETKPLPPDMQKFFDEAKDGVVLFSIGSIVPDHLLSKSYFDNFISVFRRLPQRVLWKTSTEIVGLPENVMTSKWVPQQDVLAHPNTVLFITHGGLFSQHEAINYGVPVVCMPFLVDQPMNAKFYEVHEIGVRLFFDTLSEETIHSALATVLNNSKYKATMQRMSRIYRDRSMSAEDSLVFWVEYVLRHGGAHHLRPSSSTMPFYQLALLDVVATVLAAILSVGAAIWFLLSRLIRLVRPRRGVDSTKKRD